MNLNRMASRLPGKKNGEIILIDKLMAGGIVFHKLYTLKVVCCEICKNHFHRPQWSLDLLMVLVLEFGPYSLMSQWSVLIFKGLNFIYHCFTQRLSSTYGNSD